MEKNRIVHTAQEKHLLHRLPVASRGDPAPEPGRARLQRSALGALPSGTPQLPFGSAPRLGLLGGKNPLVGALLAPPALRCALSGPWPWPLHVRQMLVARWRACVLPAPPKPAGPAPQR
eukprot:CAMPEP_0204408618 /NCGR_PEP_ID=MMETSP0470-20130426/9564_1 /ASSEMBLY_ACC=CAM_ASM_000385 /TAXON_ID=2969 /ORGANISM="Oxyrrhis marina" /LENGTH=118 /DNA_ID=CAMNT_0051404391 /DNA_START=484 /DNA_END=837 /DNA_ORIENTATION=+